MNWLTYQLALMPDPGTILHIGAGLCRELPDYQQIEPDRIILVEPNPETINALRQRAADYDNVTLLQAAVAAEAGRARLHRFNFPELDSLRKPTGLYQLLPGLQKIGQTEVSTITPAQLVRRLSLADSTNNWLVLEAPGEEAMMLEELNRTGALQNFSRLIVRTGAEPFYGDNVWSAPLLELLESCGYFVDSSSDTDDADWPRYHLKFQPLALKCRDLETRLGESQQQLDRTSEESRAKAAVVDALKSRIEDLEKTRDELESARHELSRQAEASTQALEKAKAEWDKQRQALEEKKAAEIDALKSQVAELEKTLIETRETLQDKDQQIETLQAKAEERERKLADLTEKALSQLQSESNSLAEFSETHTENLRDLESRLLKQVLPRIDNSARQIESYIGIQSLLQTGEAPPELHGWPISPDLALYLMRLITANNYDLIIEFGSGSSTLLMARTVAELAPNYLENESGKRSKKLLETDRRDLEDNRQAQSAGRGISAQRAQIPSEITPRILAFEHMREYHEKTSEIVATAGCSPIVELMYAPLKDLHLPDEGHFLYYDCEETLESIEKNFSGEPKKILALVDGPPGKTGKNARFPALHMLLTYFSHHHIDIILDDTNREDEKEILRKWQELMDKRGTQFSIETLAFEKGATLLSIT